MNAPFHFSITFKVTSLSGICGKSASHDEEGWVIQNPKLEWHTGVSFAGQKVVFALEDPPSVCGGGIRARTKGLLHTDVQFAPTYLTSQVPSPFPSHHASFTKKWTGLLFSFFTTAVNDCAISSAFTILEFLLKIKM